MVIGLTGGIATGKSTIAALLAQFGATVIDADQVSRDLMGPGSSVFLRIIEAFGSELLNADGSLDREALGRIVFADPSRRRQLEEITHPPIWEELSARLKASVDRGDPVTVLMVPLLLENGRQGSVDQVWVVDLPEELQIARLISRNGLTVEQAQARLAAQMSAPERRAKAHQVIDNSGTLEETASRVRSAWDSNVGGGSGEG